MKVLKKGLRVVLLLSKRSALIHLSFLLLRFGLGKLREFAKFKKGNGFKEFRGHHFRKAKIARFARPNHHGLMKNSMEFDQERYSGCYG